MYYVYVLKNLENVRIYIGYTSNLRRRIREHRNKKIESTKHWKNFQLIFYEAFAIEDDAKRREQYFKTTKGKKALRLMLKGAIV